MLAYTSGTTGRPKGAVHVHGGFVVKMRCEGRFGADLRTGDRVHLGDRHRLDHGPLAAGQHPRPRAHGGALRRRTRLPGRGPHLATRRAPPPDASWACRRRSCARYGRPATNSLDQADLSALRLFGSTGEPWNPDPWLWLFERVGGGTRPIMNISGGTEIASSFLGLRALSAAQAMHARAAVARHGDGRLRPGRAVVARRGRRARVHAAVARHDARHLGRPRALPRHLLAALSRSLDARRLGLDRRRRRLVPARPLRRHAERRGQAHRTGRVRIGPRR